MNKSKNGKKKATRKASSKASGRLRNTNQKQNWKVVHMAPGTEAYARMLANPSTGPLVGMPSYPALLSRKVRVWTKGIASTNTNGFGFLILDPSRAIANDQPSVIYSLASGTTLQTVWTNPPAGLDSAGAVSNSDYSTAQIGEDPDQIQFKITAAEVKVRFIGTELNRGGQVVGFHDPDHQTLYARTIAMLDGEEQSRRFPVDRRWKRVLYRPVDNDDSNFTGTFALETSPPDPADVSYFMGFVFQTPVAQGPQDFEYECYTTFEVVGLNARSMTPSNFDASGYAAVHAVSNLGTHLYPTEESGPIMEKRVVQSVAEHLAKHSSHVSMHVGTLDDVQKAVSIGKDIASTAATLSGANIGELIAEGLGALFSW